MGPHDRATVRVLVQEIPEGMPEFRPGDRVRETDCDEEFVIDGPPYRSHVHGRWWMPTTCGNTLCCEDFTKLPPETSRLIRVTGPGGSDAVDVALDMFKDFLREWTRGVRVEVVDEPTDEGVR